MGPLRSLQRGLCLEQGAQPTAAFLRLRVSFSRPKQCHVSNPVEITFRALCDVEDYRACEALQRATWGSDFQEVVPAAILKIAQKVGGVATGAFTANAVMAGFVFGITGWKEGKPCHWSHMLAVDLRFRDQGIGQQLKQHQRDDLLRRGVNVMFWTYDPLVARNAHLNLCRLGARISEYVPHMYGSDDDNSLDNIIGTDRFIVHWDLKAQSARPDEPVTETRLANATINPSGGLLPSKTDLPSWPQVSIGIPGDIHTLKATAPELAAVWRANTRKAFLHYLASGYEVTGFSKDNVNQAGFYQLRQVD